MKTFTTSGTGNQQTLSPIETDKIPVYDSVTDAESDLANLAENQIIATHDTGSELSAPVDTVQSGNMHAVTSNAVAEKFIYLKARNKTLTTDSKGYVSITDIFPNIDNNYILVEGHGTCQRGSSEYGFNAKATVTFKTDTANSDLIHFDPINWTWNTNTTYTNVNVDVFVIKKSLFSVMEE